NHPLGWGIKYNLQPQKAKVELWDNFSWGRIKRMRNYKGSQKKKRFRIVSHNISFEYITHFSKRVI
ncbi:MAG: hypothetical protein Q8835_03350, partial [Sweet potato little leaf phytoplasma]|nr:hypothetical protein [Sweet potato little leaf phytoplasma]